MESDGNPPKLASFCNLPGLPAPTRGLARLAPNFQQALYFHQKLASFLQFHDSAFQPNAGRCPSYIFALKNT